MNRKKFRQILSEKQGASLIFVLAITLMLLAIGASVLTAASTSAGAAKSKLQQERLELYSNSVVKAIASSLMETGSQNALGNQLLLALYKNAEVTIPPTPLPNVIEMSFGVEVSGIPNILELKLAYPQRQIAITEAIPHTPALVVAGVTLSPATPAQPKKASVNAEIAFTIEMDFDGMQSKTIAVFRLRNAKIENDVIISPGEWRLIQHEKF